MTYKHNMERTVLALRCSPRTLTVAAVQMSQTAANKNRSELQSRRVECLELLRGALSTQQTGLAAATALRPLQAFMRPGMHVVVFAEKSGRESAELVAALEEAMPLLGVTDVVVLAKDMHAVHSAVKAMAGMFVSEQEQTSKDWGKAWHLRTASRIQAATAALQDPRHFNVPQSVAQSYTALKAQPRVHVAEAFWLAFSHLEVWQKQHKAGSAAAERKLEPVNQYGTRSSTAQQQLQHPQQMTGDYPQTMDVDAMLYGILGPPDQGHDLEDTDMECENEHSDAETVFASAPTAAAGTAAGAVEYEQGPAADETGVDASALFMLAAAAAVNSELDMLPDETLIVPPPRRHHRAAAPERVAAAAALQAGGTAKVRGSKGRWEVDGEALNSKRSAAGLAVANALGNAGLTADRGFGSNFKKPRLLAGNVTTTTAAAAAGALPASVGVASPAVTSEVRADQAGAAKTAEAPGRDHGQLNTCRIRVQWTAPAGRQLTTSDSAKPSLTRVITSNLVRAAAAATTRAEAGGAGQSAQLTGLQQQAATDLQQAGMNPFEADALAAAAIKEGQRLAGGAAQQQADEIKRHNPPPPPAGAAATAAAAASPSFSSGSRTADRSHPAPNQPALVPSPSTTVATTAAEIGLQHQQLLQMRVMSTQQFQAGLRNAVLTTAAFQQQYAALPGLQVQPVASTAGMPMAAAAGAQAPMVAGIPQQQHPFLGLIHQQQLLGQQQAHPQQQHIQQQLFMQQQLLLSLLQQQQQAHPQPQEQQQVQPGAQQQQPRHQNRGVLDLSNEPVDLTNDDTPM